MELVILLVAGVALAGWWIWKEGQHEKNGHPLEGATKPIEPYPFPVSRPEEGKTVHAVDVGSASPAEAVAIVEQEQTKVKKAKKPAAPKKKTAKVEAVVEQVKKPRKSKK